MSRRRAKMSSCDGCRAGQGGKGRGAVARMMTRTPPGGLSGGRDDESEKVTRIRSHSDGPQPRGNAVPALSLPPGEPGEAR